MDKPFPKVKDYELKQRISECIVAGRWDIHPHAQDRSVERIILTKDVRYVLLNGKAGKPRWKPDSEPKRCWWYNMNGTIDSQKLKMVFIFLDREKQPFLRVYTVCRG